MQYPSCGRIQQVLVLRPLRSAVRAITCLTRLPHGLTVHAIKAARAITFIPATKDGKPVSMWMQLEYNFNIY